MPSQQIIVYPSQFKSFKAQTKLFSDKIAAYTEKSPLSAFKRNDAMADCFGYANHSQLVETGKSHALSDTGTPFCFGINIDDINDETEAGVRGESPLAKAIVAKFAQLYDVDKKWVDKSFSLALIDVMSSSIDSELNSKTHLPSNMRDVVSSIMTAVTGLVDIATELPLIQIHVPKRYEPQVLRLKAYKNVVSAGSTKLRFEVIPVSDSDQFYVCYSVFSTSTDTQASLWNGLKSELISTFGDTDLHIQETKNNDYLTVFGEKKF